MTGQTGKSGEADRAMAELLGMSRQQLHARACRYFKHGGGTEPDVVLVCHGPARAVFKDYGRSQGGFSRWIAPILVRREVSALTALNDLDGVPALLRRLDRHGILIEYCPARPWRRVKPGKAAYDRLENLIDTLHERGMAHADLRGGGNLLVDPHEQPYIIDFVSRVHRGAAWNLPRNWLFRQFVAADYSAVAKLRVRCAEHLATPRDYELCEPVTPLARLARAMGRGVRRLVRLFVSRR